MTSSRIILIFLGFIFLIIVILSSSQISGVLRQRFGSFIPTLKPSIEEIVPTPTTPFIEEKLLAPTPSIIYSGGGKKGDLAGEIPATGPEDFFWVILGGSFLIGVALKKITDPLCS